MRLLSSLATLSLASLAYGAVEPLFVTGLIDSMSAATADLNSGGTITVNGFTITVPKNLIVQFPAAWVPWQTVTASSLTGYEVSISGNVVDGKPISGQIELAQTLLNAGSGVIDKVNVGGNSFTIVGGPTVVLNDPNAVYSVGYKDKPLFTADDENPSITAFSGFPMCIPRSTSDPLCPASNRPGTKNAGTDDFTPKDPLLMAPFLPGDYVEFSGIQSGSTVYAFEVVAANVQIRTDGTKDPVYIRMEDAIIGVFDSTTGVAANNEFGDTRFIGYTSDANAAVTINAVDVDPCTGDETYRTVGSASLKAGDARNKFIWRGDSTVASKYTREYRIVASAGIKNTTNGILAGQYVQPVTEWIFPEPTVPGIKPPALNFAVFNNLANGIFQDDFKFGQLDPWPGATAPTAAGCSATTPKPSSTATSSATGTSTSVASPKANVGTNFTTIPGALVKLSAKDDNNNDGVTYSWIQVSGPKDENLVPTTASTAASFSFTAPAQAATPSIVERTFKCTISLKDSSSSASITITTNSSAPDTVEILSYTHTTQQGGTINVVGRTNVLWGQNTTPAGPKLTLQFSNAAGTTFTDSGIAGVYQGDGKWSFGSRSVKKPVSIKVVSERKGASAAVTSTTTKKRRSLGWSAKWRAETVESTEE